MTSFLAEGARTTKALGKLRKLEEQDAGWQDALAAKIAEHDAIEARAGEDVLAAAEGQQAAVSARISKQLGELRAAIAVDERTVAASAERVADGKREVLRAEAADLRDLLDAARVKHAEHVQQLQQLLDQVQAHDNAEYRPYQPSREEVDYAGAVTLVYRSSHSDVLQAEVDRLTLLVKIADAAAAGQPPPLFDRNGFPILAEMYSPRVRGAGAYFPELAG
jgi:hypothetical protein